MSKTDAENKGVPDGAVPRVVDQPQPRLYDQCAVDELNRQIAELKANLRAETERCIRVVRDCDERGDWTADLVEQAIREGK